MRSRAEDARWLPSSALAADFGISRTPKLLRAEPLKALMIGAFVRGLSMRDVDSLREQAGLRKLSTSTASRMCEKLARFEAFKRRRRSPASPR